MWDVGRYAAIFRGVVCRKAGLAGLIPRKGQRNPSVITYQSPEKVRQAVCLWGQCLPCSCFQQSDLKEESHGSIGSKSQINELRSEITAGAVASSVSFLSKATREGTSLSSTKQSHLEMKMEDLTGISWCVSVLASERERGRWGKRPFDLELDRQMWILYGSLVVYGYASLHLRKLVTTTALVSQIGGCWW